MSDASRWQFLGSSGFKVLALYLVLHYFFPAVLTLPSHPLSVRESAMSTYHGIGGGIWPLVIVIGVPLLAVLLHWVLPCISGRHALKRFLPYQMTPLTAVLAVLFLALSVQFRREYGIGFRHSGTGMMSAAGYMPLLFALKMYFKVFVFFVLVRALRRGHIEWLQRLLLFLVAGATYFSLMWATDAVLILLAGGLAVTPVRFMMRPLYTPGIPTSLGAWIRKTTTYAVIAVGCAAMVFVGVANKIGTRETLSAVRSSDQFYDVIYARAGVRASMHYASLLEWSSDHMYDVDVQARTVQAPFSDLSTRLCQLTAGSRCQPSEDAWSVSRMNYRLVYRSFHPRAGASPGLVTSGMIFPLFPINLIVLCIFVVIVVRLINRTLPQHRGRLSIIGAGLVYFFVEPVLSNPWDPLIIFVGPSPIYMILILWTLVYFKGQRRLGRSDV